MTKKQDSRRQHPPQGGHRPTIICSDELPVTPGKEIVHQFVVDAGEAKRWTCEPRHEWLVLDEANGALRARPPTGRWDLVITVDFGDGHAKRAVTIVCARSSAELKYLQKSFRKRIEIAAAQGIEPMSPDGMKLLAELHKDAHEVLGRIHESLAQGGRRQEAWRAAVRKLAEDPAVDVVKLATRLKEAVEVSSLLRSWVADRNERVRIGVETTGEGPALSALAPSACLTQLRDHPRISEILAHSDAPPTARFEKPVSHLGPATLTLDWETVEPIRVPILLHAADPGLGLSNPDPSRPGHQEFLARLESGIEQYYETRCPGNCSVETLREFHDLLRTYGYGRTRVAEEALARVEELNRGAEEAKVLRDVLREGIRKLWPDACGVDETVDLERPEATIARVRNYLVAELPAEWHADLKVKALPESTGEGLVIAVEFVGIRVGTPIRLTNKRFPFAEFIKRDIYESAKSSGAPLKPQRIAVGSVRWIDAERKRILLLPHHLQPDAFLELLVRIHGDGLLNHQEALLTAVSYTAKRGLEHLAHERFVDARRYFLEYYRLHATPGLDAAVHGDDTQFHIPVIRNLLQALIERRFPQDTFGRGVSVGEALDETVETFGAFARGNAANATLVATALLEMAEISSGLPQQMLRRLVALSVVGSAFFKIVFKIALERATDLRNRLPGLPPSQLDGMVADAALLAFDVKLIIEPVRTFLASTLEVLRELAVTENPRRQFELYQPLDSSLQREEMQTRLHDSDNVKWDREQKREFDTFFAGATPILKERLTALGGQKLGMAKLGARFSQAELVEGMQNWIQLVLRNDGNGTAADVECNVREVLRGTLNGSRVVTVGRILAGEEKYVRLCIRPDKKDAVELSVHVKYVTQGKIQTLDPHHSLQLRGSDTLFETLASPYHPTTGITRSEDFYGREPELKEIIQRIGQPDGPDKPLILHGRRKVGKTSILQRFMRTGRGDRPIPEVERFQNSRLIAFVDFQAVKKGRPDVIYELLGTAILESATNYPTFPSMDMQSVFYDSKRDPDRVFASYIDRVAPWLKAENLRLLLLLDEFDTLIRRLAVDGKELDHPLFSSLRGVFQKHSEVVAPIFCGQEDLISLLQQYSTRLFALTSVRFELGRFESREEAYQLVREPLRKRSDRIIWDEGVVEGFVERTGAHPYYLQVVCNRLVQHIRERRTLLITHSDVAAE